jgi:DNA-binding SARP family transcriptional activator
MIARGGQAVSCVRLWESLWPDSDGDLSARNLTITLHRLRNLLGTNAAVLHHDGKLSLNPRTCWVDVWEFENLATTALRSAPSGDGKEWEAQLRAALGLYVGDFLALEAEESWMLEPRLRWKTRFERIVSALSSRLESANRFDEAVDVCQQALEIEPLNELLYRRLMNCYLVRGEIAAVVRVYSSCRDVLGKGLGTRPALETERIYRAALEASAAAVYRSGSQPVRLANAPS